MRQSSSNNDAATPGESAATSFLHRWGWAVALLGAAVATLGDLGQLWIVNAARPVLQLAAPPRGLLVIATLAGTFGIPLYALGYCVRAHRARRAAPRLSALVAWAGVALAIVGGTVHAATGFAIANNAGGIAGGLAPLEGIFSAGPIVIALWGLATVTFLCASIGELCLPQPRALRICNPLVATLALSAAAAMMPMPWPDFIAPASLNIAHLVFFARLGVFD